MLCFAFGSKRIGSDLVGWKNGTKRNGSHLSACPPWLLYENLNLERHVSLCVGRHVAPAPATATASASECESHSLNLNRRLYRRLTPSLPTRLIAQLCNANCCYVCCVVLSLGCRFIHFFYFFFTLRRVLIAFLGEMMARVMFRVCQIV